MGDGTAADGTAGSPTPYHGGKHAGLAPRPHETKTASPEFFEAALPRAGGGPPSMLPAPRINSHPDRVKYSRRVFVDHLFAPPCVVENTGRAPETPQGMRPLPAPSSDGRPPSGPRQRSGTGARGFGPFDQRCLAPRRQRRGSRYWRFGEGPRPHLNSTIRDRRPPQSRRCTYCLRLRGLHPGAGRRRRCESPAEAHAQWWHSPGSPAPAHCPGYSCQWP